jgi:hypothetical protein
MEPQGNSQRFDHYHAAIMHSCLYIFHDTKSGMTSVVFPSTYIHQGVNNNIITSFIEDLAALVEQQLEDSSGQRMQVAVHQRMLVAETMHAGTQSCSRRFTCSLFVRAQKQAGHHGSYEKTIAKSLPLQVSSFPPEHIDCRKQQRE